MKKRLESDRILSISAIVIAVASIVVTMWEGAEIRLHNRLSVRPKFEIFYSPDFENNSMKWLIVNNGIGPGFYKYSSMSIDGKQYKLNHVPLQQISEALRVDGVSISETSSFNPGLTIISGGSRTILGLALKENQPSTKEFWNIHERIKFEIGYESMYNELFVCKYPMDSN